MEGRTRLVPKTTPSSNLPKDYRPIDVLNTTHKLLTSVIACKLQDHLQRHDLVPPEQRAFWGGRRGAHDCLLLDQAVVQWHKRRRKDLSVAWIDYRKAYDLVDHDLLRFVLEVIGFNGKLRSCIEGLVLNWTTRFQLKTNDGELRTELVRYGRGLFQGDSLSCYEFVTITIPISYALYKHSFLRVPTVEGF